MFCLFVFQFTVQIMAAKGAGKNTSLGQIYHNLQENDQEFLLHVSSADPMTYSLMNISDANVPINLVRLLLDYYDKNAEVFICNGHRLFITLEDVLYMTGLPISGDLIANAERNKSNFMDLLELPVEETTWSLFKIKSIVLDRNKSYDIQLKALRFMLIHCFVVPTTSHLTKGDLLAYVRQI